MDREKVARDIEKTIETIRKKYHALKTNKIDEDNSFEQKYKPIIQPLQMLATEHKTVKPFLMKEEQEQDEIKPTIDITLPENIPLQSMSTNQPMKKSLRSQYMEMRKRSIDNIYGVHFSDDGYMIGDKRFTVDGKDNIYVDGVKYKGTSGLYELIFKRKPNNRIYTNRDLLNYKKILTMSNVHRDDNGLLKRNKAYKYLHVIRPMFANEKHGHGLSMQLNNNKIDYVHWDDANELIERLRLLVASQRAGNNAHDNEIQSIIEELYEAGIILKQNVKSLNMSVS